MRVDDVGLEAPRRAQRPQREDRVAALATPARSSTARSSSWPRSTSARSSWATKTPRSGSSGPGYICETSRILTARALRVVHAELLAQHVADLADRAARPQRLAHRREQVPVAPRRLAHRRERRLRGSPASRSARTRAVRSSCRRSASGSSRCSSIGSSSPSAKRLTPTITRSPASTSLRVAEGRLLDLVLDEALLDRRDGAAELVDALDQLPRALPRARRSAPR